jgi:hypothetical protein
MTVDPATLARLSRDQLIERARGIGVAEPEPLTRAELQDEIVRRGEHDERRRKILRGWFGVARDLVASLVDQGLHLPDAAAIIRGSEPPEAAARGPVSTVTLAEIFAKQGHRKKALRILADVLEVEPEHDVARGLHERLVQDEAPEVSPPIGAPPGPDGREKAPLEASTSETEPLGAGEEIVPVERDAAYTRVRGDEVAIYWELAAAGIERAQERWPGARPVVQLVTVAPHAANPRRRVRELEIEETLGSLSIAGLAPGTEARAAVGWRHGRTFVPVVVAAELADDDTLRWTPWRYEPSAAALARATALLRD